MAHCYYLFHDRLEIIKISDYLFIYKQHDLLTVLINNKVVLDQFELTAVMCKKPKVEVNESILLKNHIDRYDINERVEIEKGYCQ